VNKKFLLLPLCLIAGSLISCNWQVPEKISIKTNASYSFSLGEMSYPNKNKSEDGINIYEKIAGNLSNGVGESLGELLVLDYNPESEDKDIIQQFALKIPIQQFDVDFSQYLDQVDLEGNLQTMSMNYPINIPEFGEINQSQDIDIKEINKTINKLVTITTMGNQNVKCKVNMVEGNNFESIIYETGTFEIQLYDALKVVNHVNATIKVDGEKVTIKDGKGSFPLDGKTITKEGMQFDTSSIGAKYTLIGTVNAESKISKVEGLTLSTPLEYKTNDISLSTGNDSALKECVVKTGSAEVNFKVPDSWTNVSNETVTTITEGLTKNGAALQFTPAAPTVDLNKAVYTNGNIKVTPNVKLVFTNSTIVFAEQPSFNFKLNISELESAKIGMSTDQSLKQELSTDLSSDVLSILKMVEWKAGGVEVKAINTLPAGNPISVKVSSGFMGISDVTQVIASGVAEEQTLNWNCAEGYETYIGSDKNATPKQYDAIDFAAEIMLPNYDADAKVITLNNVTLGDSYMIQLVATPTVDWNAVVINNDAAAVTGTKDMELNLADQIGQMDTPENKFSDKVRLDSLPIYLFCDMGELGKVFSNPTISGNISMCPGAYETVDKVVDGQTVQVKQIKEDASKATYLLGSATDKNAKMDAIPLPVFEKDENGVYKTVTQQITSGISADLAEMMDQMMAGGEGLSIAYTVKFSTGNSGSEIKLVKKDIEETGSAKIDMAAILVLPLKLRVVEDIKIENILTLLGIGVPAEGEDASTYDLLNRTSKDDMEDVKLYAEAIKSASIVVKQAQLPLFLEKPITLGIDLDGPKSDSVTPVDINFMTATEDSKPITIAVSPEQLLETYPLQPAVSLSIKQGLVGIPRNIKISGIISLNVKTNGNHKIQVWEKNADNTTSDAE